MAMTFWTVWRGLDGMVQVAAGKRRLAKRTTWRYILPAIFLWRVDLVDISLSFILYISHHSHQHLNIRDARRGGQAIFSGSTYMLVYIVLLVHK